MIHIHGTGWIKSDLELRTTPRGTRCVVFDIAVKRDFKNESTQYEYDYFTCVAWRNLAETICRYCKNGDFIDIEDGILEVRQKVDEDGTKKKRVELVINRMQFINRQATGAHVDERISEDLTRINTEGVSP